MLTVQRGKNEGRVALQNLVIHTYTLIILLKRGLIAARRTLWHSSFISADTKTILSEKNKPGR